MNELMKAAILAGGFAKRLWPLTKNTAKALLEVAGKHVIDHVVDNLKETSIDKIYISTNKKFEADFEKWKIKKELESDIELIVENHTQERKKMGSIGAVAYLIEQGEIHDDLLIIAGDNIFDFDLNELICTSKKFKGPVIACFNMQSKKLVKDTYGVVTVNENGIITGFEEKPSKPRSTLISTGIYLIPRSDLDLFKEYLDENNNPDAFGYFLQWLHTRKPIRAHVFSGMWYDIGSKESLRKADFEIPQRIKDNLRKYNKGYQIDKIDSKKSFFESCDIYVDSSRVDALKKEKVDEL